MQSFHHLVETFYRNATDAFVLILFSCKFLPSQLRRILPGELDESPDTLFQTTFHLSKVRKCDVGNNSTLTERWSI